MSTLRVVDDGIELDGVGSCPLVAKPDAVPPR